MGSPTADGDAAGAGAKGKPKEKVAAEEGGEGRGGAGLRSVLDFPQCQVSSCMYGGGGGGGGDCVLSVLEEMMNEAVGMPGGKEGGGRCRGQERGGGEAVLGMKWSLFEGSRMVVEAYLALSTQLFAEKVCVEG